MFNNIFNLKIGKKNKTKSMYFINMTIKQKNNLRKKKKFYNIFNYWFSNLFINLNSLKKKDANYKINNEFVILLSENINFFIKNLTFFKFNFVFNDEYLNFYINTLNYPFSMHFASFKNFFKYFFYVRPATNLKIKKNMLFFLSHNFFNSTFNKCDLEINKYSHYNGLYSSDRWRELFPENIINFLMGFYAQEMYENFINTDLNIFNNLFNTFMDVIKTKNKYFFTFDSLIFDASYIIQNRLFNCTHLNLYVWYLKKNLNIGKKPALVKYNTFLKTKTKKKIFKYEKTSSIYNSYYKWYIENITWSDTLEKHIITHNLNNDFYNEHSSLYYDFFILNNVTNNMYGNFKYILSFSNFHFFNLKQEYSIFSSNFNKRVNIKFYNYINTSVTFVDIKIFYIFFYNKTKKKNYDIFYQNYKKFKLINKYKLNYKTYQDLILIKNKLNDILDFFNKTNCIISYFFFYKNINSLKKIIIIRFKKMINFVSIKNLTAVNSNFFYNPDKNAYLMHVLETDTQQDVELETKKIFYPLESICYKNNTILNGQQKVYLKQKEILPNKIWSQTILLNLLNFIKSLGFKEYYDLKIYTIFFEAAYKKNYPKFDMPFIPPILCLSHDKLVKGFYYLQHSYNTYFKYFFHEKKEYIPNFDEKTPFDYNVIITPTINFLVDFDFINNQNNKKFIMYLEMLTEKNFFTQVEEINYLNLWQIDEKQKDDVIPYFKKNFEIFDYYLNLSTKPYRMQPIFNYLASRFHSNFSFFLVKNKFFINHKKKEKDDIIFFHVKKNKIKTTNYRFFKLFFRYRKKLYYNYKVIFFIKYVLLPDKDYITTFLNLTFKRFSKNIKNKIIKNDKLNFNFHFSLANIKKYFLKKN